MNFRYRYAPYGTRFVPVDGHRTSGSEAPANLHANELVLDVGAACWGYAGEERAIVDHHFFRPDDRQYPSAAAAVLHHARRIHEAFAWHSGDLWLVSHRQPDFDSFSSMYLARNVIAGNLAVDELEKAGLTSAGWTAREIDWFQPDTRALSSGLRWAVLLAAYASCVDQCRRTPCPRERALQSVFYAALRRGRDYQRESSGAVEFFDEVQAALKTRELNPLYDSVLEGSERFAPELHLLDRESAAYDRDIRRARRMVVYLQRAETPFQEWFPSLKAAPLFTPDGKFNPVHARAPQQHFVQADGIFLRDPESLLFKDWARMDLENSSMARGFLFTAIAYTGGRRGGARNSSDYYFALDPERADGAHLYNVWARLQEHEILALHAPENAALLAEWQQANRPPRPEFEKRAAGPHGSCFFDPWFDGHNYECTIVPTPNGGSVMREGVAHDLSDDQVGTVVREELESAIWDSPFELRQYPPAADGASAPGRSEVYRFCRVRLEDGVQIRQGMMAQQICEILWKELHSENSTPPPGFAERHVLKSDDWVGVWSRRGVAMAYKAAATGRVDEAERLLEQLASLAQGLQNLIGSLKAATEERQAAHHAGDGAHDPAHAGDGAPFRPALELGEKLLQEVGNAQYALALPDNRLVSRFFEASRLEAVLQTLRDVYLSAVERAQSSTMNRHMHAVAAVQSKLEWLEVFIVGFYAVDLAHLVGERFDFNATYTGCALLALALVVPALLVWLLKPHKEGGGVLPIPRLRKAAMLLVLLFGLYVAGGFLSKRFLPPSGHSGESAAPVSRGAE